VTTALLNHLKFMFQPRDLRFELTNEQCLQTISEPRINTLYATTNDVLEGARPHTETACTSAPRVFDR